MKVCFEIPEFLFNADVISVLVIQIVILWFVLYVLFHHVKSRIQRMFSNVKADMEVSRVDETLGRVNVAYGLVIVIVYGVVSESVNLDGYKSAILLIDYALITGLFFFSKWFRNAKLLVWINATYKV